MDSKQQHSHNISTTCCNSKFYFGCESIKTTYTKQKHNETKKYAAYDIPYYVDLGSKCSDVQHTKHMRLCSCESI